MLGAGGEAGAVKRGARAISTEEAREMLTGPIIYAVARSMSFDVQEKLRPYATQLHILNENLRYLRQVLPFDNVSARRELCDLEKRYSVDFKKGSRFEFLERAVGIKKSMDQCNEVYQHLHARMRLYNLYDDFDVATSDIRTVLHLNATSVIKRTKELRETGQLDVRLEVIKGICVAFRAERDAYEIFQRLREDVERHVQERMRSGKCFLTVSFLGDDVLRIIADAVGFRGVCSLMGANKDMFDCASLKDMRPHLRIRAVDFFLFPHRVGYVPFVGENVATVYKSNVVSVVVDLVVCVPKNCDLATNTHFSVSPLALRYGPDRTVRSAHRKDVEQCSLRTFAEERGPPGKKYVRLEWTSFFEDNIVCEVQMVYADTHELVDGNPLEFSKESFKRMNKMSTMTTYMSRDGVPYPAFCQFRVNRLSSSDKGRLYKFKVTGVGTVKATSLRDSYQQKLVAYSCAFACVATGRPLKRKRASRT